MAERWFRLHDIDVTLNAAAAEIVDAVFDVRAELGAGLLESVYISCLLDELRTRSLHVEREVSVPLVYKGRPLGQSLRVDLLVNGSIIVEAKALADLHPVHFAQLLTYLRLADKPLGLLVNFNAVPLGNGIHRRVNTRPPK